MSAVGTPLVSGDTSQEEVYEDKDLLVEDVTVEPIRTKTSPAAEIDVRRSDFDFNVEDIESGIGLPYAGTIELDVTAWGEGNASAAGVLRITASFSPDPEIDSYRVFVGTKARGEYDLQPPDETAQVTAAVTPTLVIQREGEEACRETHEIITAKTNPERNEAAENLLGFVASRLLRGLPFGGILGPLFSLLLPSLLEPSNSSSFYSLLGNSICEIDTRTGERQYVTILVPTSIAGEVPYQGSLEVEFDFNHQFFARPIDW